MKQWTANDDAALIQAWHRGDTCAAIGEQLECFGWEAWHRVQRLRRAGAELPPRKPRWTPERRQALADARCAGRSLRELEADFEITRGTLTSQLRTLRRLGYDLGDRPEAADR
jgi:biotin operon repressor